jgi:TrmH family RNA methyltransferase
MPYFLHYSLAFYRFALPGQTEFTGPGRAPNAAILSEWQPEVLILHQGSGRGRKSCQDHYISSQLCVTLIATRNPLNIGAAARAMANFGLDDLRVVNPYEVAWREAVSAVGGLHVLKAARIYSSVGEAVADCSLVVGTTAGQRRDLRQPIDRLEAAMPRIRGHSGRTALMFGSEKFGLSNEDLSFCHSLIRIPTAPETPSMNLGQAVAVCLYEFVRADHTPARARNESGAGRAITGSDSEQLTRMLIEVLEESGYTNRITSVSTERKIRRWVRRTRIIRRDVPLLLGILRQILWKFKNG